MQSALLDSSIYIAALRKGEGALLSLRRLGADTPLWLSAVVLEELYAGAMERHPAPVERLERDFERIGRILVPNLNDWIQAGRTLSRLALKHDYEQIGRARLTNDTLIAMSAARTGICVITANERDFAKIAEFRPFKWELIRL